MSADPIPQASVRRAVFVDRDGTMNIEVDHLHRVDDLELLPGVDAALVALRQAGYSLVGVTNQSAVARGLLSVAGLAEIHDELARRLASGGAWLDAIYHCPHHPDTGEPPWRCRCACRKPAPGMLHQAAQELGIDLSASFMVGDSLSDLQAGWAAGCRSVLVRTGYGSRTLGRLADDMRSRIAYVADDLAAAASWMVAQAGALQSLRIRIT